MDPLPGTTLCPILAVPGLYISDRFAARSNALLVEHGITHILSVVRWEDRARSSGYETDAETDASSIIRNHVDIDDDPMEDLLLRLDGMLEWVHEAIGPNPSKEGGGGVECRTDNPPAQTRGRVLVHCNQGISRSGSVIVAYIMRYLLLPYAAALTTARESRSLIMPNIGFEYQLRMWETCGFDVFLGEEGQEPEQNEPQEGEQRQRKKKPEYAAWKEEVAQIYNHQQYRDFQRAREELIRSLVARLLDLRENDV
ncbi:protein-tyrosine phosphatase-like protein [Aspergillus pseudoustus]|uniref:protein-tyrosine-phosphatase n=1 Tax=Aspergillus pseudoustus TaxID=1810923 RepID=A0ABR4JYB2_9EURO